MASGKVSLVQTTRINNVMAANEHYNGTSKDRPYDRSFRRQLEGLAIRYRGSAETLIAELCSVLSPIYDAGESQYTSPVQVPLELKSS